MTPQNRLRAPKTLRKSGVRALPVRWIVPLAVTAGALAGGAYGMLRTPEYAATSYVVVVPLDTTEPAAAQGFATAFGRVAPQLALVGDAPTWAGVPAATLKRDVRTATSPDAPMISVTATSAKASTAVDMANGVARSLVVSGTQMQGSTNVRVLQFSRAIAPTGPVTPSAGLSALVGGCAGGLLGGLGLLVRPKRRREDAPAGSASVPGPASGSGASVTSSSASAAAKPHPETV
ncbi:YveK family protein [Streptomyces paludis]|uniref:lipopolysaccharide biosynthesis protein n=1 Tax=Streptomyces paludis TaxID=2282738 RepID=UPI001E5645AF|nr:lipopolysaccharide biosynthesis protein [Streptomyces paludis]